MVACPSLYLAGWDEVQRQLLAADPKEKTVMVLGHNPGWETMVSLLAGATDLRMTTANAALLTVEASDWQEALVLEGCWHLEALVRPKEI